MNNTDIVLFRHEEFGEVRTLNIDGIPWFVGKDVADNLGYQNGSRDINRHVDEDDRTKIMVFDGKQNKETIIINESGLYSLILSSKLPNARAYKRWVTSEVLPTIRKHGAYLTAEALHKTLSDPRELAKLLETLADEQEKNRQLATENAFLTVKAGYYDRILNSKNSVPVTQIAKDYGMTAIAFNKMLHEFKVQYPVGKAWVLYADYADKGYTQIKTYSITEEKSVMHTCWTQAGRLFLYQFLMERGILPVCEQEE